MIHSILLKSSATRTMASEIVPQFQELPADTSTGNLVWYITIPILAIVISFVYYKLDARKAGLINDPDLLMDELLQAHRVNRAGVVLLRRVAKHAELRQPASILLSPDHFKQAITTAGAVQTLSSKEEHTLEKARWRLFGDLD